MVLERFYIERGSYLTDFQQFLESPRLSWAMRMRLVWGVGLRNYKNLFCTLLATVTFLLEGGVGVLQEGITNSCSDSSGGAGCSGLEYFTNNAFNIDILITYYHQK